MEYAETGKIKVIRETQTFASGFSKREFVLTTVGEYPQDLKMEVVKDKCNLLDKFKVGQTVKASFNLRGSYHAQSDAYYVSLQAWKIEAGANVAAPVAPPVADPIGDDSEQPF